MRFSVLPSVFCAASILAASPAFAGYLCASADRAQSLELTDDFRMGLLAELILPEASAHYRARGARIEKFISVIDPETEQSAAQIEGRERVYLMRASDPDLGSAFGLRVAIEAGEQPNQSRAQGFLIDMEGTRFEIDLPCTVTAELE